MQKRNTQQRRQDIVEWVNQQGHVQVDELAHRFATSEVTIRKDLTVLSEQGLVLRQFKGAAPVPRVPSADIPAPSARKAAIGKLAASLLHHNLKIILDCGTTTMSLLPHFAHHKNLVVMTNSLQAASTLITAENEPTVLMTGGTWDAHSQSFQGHMAEKMIAAYSFDMAFIGASGIDVARGTTTFNELIGLTQAMAHAAKQVVVMAESSKFSHKMPNLELAWGAISVLVTDSGIDRHVKEQIEQQGVKVIVASPAGEE